MRLAIITQDFPPDVGGTQTYARELAIRLSESCEDLVVVAPSRFDDSHPASAADSQLPFDVIRTPGSYNTHWLHSYRALTQLSRSRPFDATLHIQWSTAVLASRHRRLAANPRTVVIAHGRELLFRPGAFAPLDAGYDRIRRKTLTAADRVVAISEYTRRLVQGIVPGRSVDLVHNGTDPDIFRRRPSRHAARWSSDGRKVVLTMCRLVGRKGVDLLIRAMPAVVETIPEAVLLIGGTGPDEQMLRELANSLNLGDHVEFIGQVPADEVVDYYNLCDVFVMPPRELPPDVEGFGIVYVEASACEKPVIGTRVGGVPDAVTDGETGLLVEPDNVPDLRDAIVRVLTDDELSACLGSSGRRRVEEYYNWNRVHDQIRGILEDSLSP